MEFGTFKDLQNALSTIPDDETLLLVNAYPFIDFNFDEGGYLELNDDEYKDGFTVYAECNYMEVMELEENLNVGWGIIHCNSYSFAVPLDATIEYGYMPLQFFMRGQSNGFPI